MNAIEFAQSIKKKYPGAYDEVDDQELAQKMVEKYPAYKDQVTFEPTTMQKIDKYGRQAIDVSQQLYNLTPMGISMKAGEAVQKGLDVAGEKTAEYLGEEGANPYVAGAAGTAVTMAPDLIGGAASLANKATGVARAAIPYARRAMGFQKTLLKTPFARGQAAKAAETALAEDIIPSSGNPEVMLNRAQSLAAKSGAAIGKTLGNVKADFRTAASDLRSLKSRLTQGTNTTKGTYGEVTKKVNTVISDLRTLSSKGANRSAKAVTDLKNRIGDTIDWLGERASQKDKKEIVTSLANSIRNMVKGAVDPSEFAQFLKNQGKFNAAKIMEIGLNNEVAGQLGNRGLSPMTMVAASGQLARGKPVQAAATLGLWEGGLRRGAGMTARTIQDAYKTGPFAGVSAARGMSSAFENLDKRRKKQKGDK